MSELQTDSTTEVASRTRPVRAPRRATGTRGTKKVTRYTLDLDGQQHLFLRMFALQNEVDASKVMRTLLYFLESDQDLANRVLDEIFGAELGDEPDEPDETDETDEGDVAASSAGPVAEPEGVELPVAV
ncbi:hypothetical protein [Tessaracoccus sp.]